MCLFVEPTMSSVLSVAWQVVDEAHRLKNDASSFNRFLSTFDAEFRLLLTGTVCRLSVLLTPLTLRQPLQNTPQELLNLLIFLGMKDELQNMPENLDEIKSLDKETVWDCLRRIHADARQVDRLREALKPHFLRRLKSDVFKELPLKSELIVPVSMSPQQRTLYKAILTKNYTALAAKVWH